MNILFKKVVSLSLASALLLSAAPTALAAEKNDTSESTQQGTCEYPADENACYEGFGTGFVQTDINDLGDEHKIISNAGNNRQDEFVRNSVGFSGAASTLPDEVDNSTNENSIYFPEIDSQGDMGSCTAWATTYYVYTYMINKARGVPTTRENTYSPTWSYNLCNCGDNGGTGDRLVYENIMHTGAADITDVPIQTSTFPASNFLSWNAKNDIWEHAAHNRLSGYHFYMARVCRDGEYYDLWSPVDDRGTPITSAKDPDLDAMKTGLSNGDIYATAVSIRSWNSTKIKNSNDPDVDNRFVNEYIVYQCDGNDGGHMLSIVGYNDNIWTDINNNNRIDNGEMGAFKIANSYSSNYCNNGFIWIAYDALNAVSAVPGFENGRQRRSILSNVSTVEVEGKDYSSGLFLKYTLNSKQRNDALIKVTAKEKSGEHNEYSGYVNPYSLFYYGTDLQRDNEVNFNGTPGEGDGTMYYDLNNLIPDITSEALADYEWQISVIDRDGNSPITVKELKIVNSATDAEHDLLGESAVTVDHTTYTFSDSDVDFTGSLRLNANFDTKCYTAPCNVKVTASTCGGTAPYQYNYEVKNIFGSVYSSGWISDKTSLVPINAGGYLSLSVSVKDADGTIVTKESDSVSYNDFSINDLETEKFCYSNVEEGCAGEKMTFKPTGCVDSNVLKPSDFKYTITKDGVSHTFYASDPEDFSLIWSPPEGGVYTISCEVTYNGTVIGERTETVFVSDVPKDCIKIYYKGYSDPNIHYCVQNGSWTKKPGVAMNADNSLSGYTHSYTIYLGSDATYANVCFNDGNGHWDSKNGANYRFKKGVYKFKKGTITAVESDLKAELSIPSNELYCGAICGDKMEISCSASGGTGSYFYKFTCKNTETNSEYIIKDYSADNTAILENNSGYYYSSDIIVKAYVMDSKGNVAESSETVSFKKLESELKTNKKTAAVGDPIKLSWEFNGTVQRPLYYYYTITDSEGNTTQLSTNSDNTADWTPDKPGTYTIDASIYSQPYVTYYCLFDSKTIEFTVTEEPQNTVVIYYKGYSHPNIHYQVGHGSWTKVPGVAMEESSELSGYTHKYVINLGTSSYANVCFNDGKGHWDSNNGKNYRFTQGTYKYSNGKITAI